MADATLSPEKVQEWEDAYKDDALDADDKAFWAARRGQYLPAVPEPAPPPPAEVQAPPPPPPPPPPPAVWYKKN